MSLVVMRQGWVALFGAASAFACGSVVVPEDPDAGRDAGAADVGAVDAGASRDGGRHDAGPPRDAGADVTLTVSVDGEASGEVRFDTAGMRCPPNCSVSVARGTAVTLTAEPGPRDVFRGWSGACAGEDVSCRVVMTASATVGAAFGPPGGFERFREIVSFEWSPADVLYPRDLNDSFEFVAGYEPTFPVLGEAVALFGEIFGLYWLSGLNLGPDQPFGINRFGWCVGASTNASGDTRAVLWHPRPSDVVEDLGTLGGPTSIAYGLNQSNDIVGQADTASVGAHAFLREASGAMHDLGTFGGDDSVATAISVALYIVGSAQRADGKFRAFRTTLSDPTNLTELGTLGGDESFAYDVAAFGALVGAADVSDGVRHAFYIADDPATTLVDIGTLGGDDSVARKINFSGVVIGMAQDANAIERPFMWSAQERVIVDLRDLLPDDATGWELKDVGGLNDFGEVLGWGLLEGQPRLFLLRP